MTTNLGSYTQFQIVGDFAFADLLFLSSRKLPERKYAHRKPLLTDLREADDGLGFILLIHLLLIEIITLME
jgi:hypothetical protein